MTVFVILHYLAEESTVTCIEQIKKSVGDFHIVVTDNASPNGSGQRLMEKYRMDEKVTILLSKENTGYARGNNMGVVYASARFSPDFVVVLNDDVEILQKDFIQRIHHIHEAHSFDLLGPDIISLFSGIHQSPKRLKEITLDMIKAKAAYVKRSQNPILMYLGSQKKSYNLLYKYELRRRRKKEGVDHTRAHENVVLHGACVVFSRRFLSHRPRPFYEGTFMYYEMEILDWLCRREGLSSRYDPSVQVLHHQNVATRMRFCSVSSRSGFVADCLLHSLKEAEKLILETREEYTGAKEFSI